MSVLTTAQRMKTFVASFLLITSLLQLLAGGNLQIISQEWDYSYSQAVTLDAFQDSLSESDYAAGVESVQLGPHEWKSSGSLSGFNVAGGLFLGDYSTTYTDDFSSDVQENQDSESMYRFSWDSEWTKGIFTYGEASSEFSIYITGRVYFRVMEDLDAVLALESELEYYSYSNDALSEIYVQVGISDLEGDSDLTFSFPLSPSSPGTLASRVFNYSKELSFEPGQYVAEFGIHLLADSGVLQAGSFTGSSVVDFSMLARSESAPDRPIGLRIEKTQDEDRMLFTASNLEVGKTYGLYGSPDLDFSESRLLGTFDRRVLYPELEIDIETLGGKHFFKLIEDE